MKEEAGWEKGLASQRAAQLTSWLNSWQRSKVRQLRGALGVSTRVPLLPDAEPVGHLGCVRLAHGKIRVLTNAVRDAIATREEGGLRISPINAPHAQTIPRINHCRGVHALQVML